MGLDIKLYNKHGVEVAWCRNGAKDSFYNTYEHTRGNFTSSDYWELLSITDMFEEWSDYHSVFSKWREGMRINFNW